MAVRLATLVSLATFVCLLAEAQAAPASAAATWSNPFCAGAAWVVPWDPSTDSPATSPASTRYIVQLAANGERDAIATVTLITDRDAYSAALARTELTGDGGGEGRYAPPVMVAFDQPVIVRFAFVDQIGVDGAEQAPCPTVVTDVRPFTAHAGDPNATPHAGGSLAYVSAKFVQALPPLTCGATYTGPDTTRDTGAVVGHYGDRPRTTVVHVFIDSNGLAMNPTIEKSSGVDGLDAAALGGIEHSRFKPARFLCTAVVSDMRIDMEYRP